MDKVDFNKLISKSDPNFKYDIEYDKTKSKV